MPGYGTHARSFGDRGVRAVSDFAASPRVERQWSTDEARGAGVRRADGADRGARSRRREGCAAGAAYGRARLSKTTLSRPKFQRCDGALGADRGLIRTVAGRGYQFTGEIRIVAASPDERPGAGLTAAEPAAVLPPTNLPEPVSELIGRDDELREIVNLAAAHRLVTLTGPGGIGKTRLALAVAAPVGGRNLPMGSGSPSWRRLPIPVWSPQPLLRRSASISAAARFRRRVWLRRSPTGGCCWCWTPASM